MSSAIVLMAMAPPSVLPGAPRYRTDSIRGRAEPLGHRGRRYLVTTRATSPKEASSMPNPVLNEKVFQEAAPTEADAGWAAPGTEAATYHEPITDGPVTPYRSVHTGAMTV